MTIAPGTRLGPYEVLSPIGAGGMGVVYRARDARLDRQVAIKVLSASDSDEHVSLLTREAKAIAALSHPNIVAVFDTGVQDGRMFVVMELLAGQTLRAALAAGGMGVRRAVDVAIQIARGLGAAHDTGLVHRDLKPENVFLTDDGQVKVLDFGLARRFNQSPSDATTAATGPGILMGTLGYMAPEQVRGQTVDPRADLFAFGAVLYEMVTGRRAFQKSTAADTMTAILTEEPPDASVSRPDVPATIDRIIRHCLEKNPGERFQSARDIAFALDSLTDAASDSVPRPVQATAGRRGMRWVILLATAALALAFGIGLERGRPREAGRVLFESKTWEPQWITNARFGPDGRTVVFSAANTGTVPSLYVITPGAIVPRPIGEPRTHLLAVSSTGEIAAITGARLTHHRIFTGTLSRMTMEGAARPWMQDVSEADFSPDGSAVAVTRLVNGRWQLEYPAGTVLHTAPTGYISDLRVSPDATRVAFFDHPGDGDNRGTLKVVDINKRVTALGGEYPGLEGLAWARDGQSILFTPADSVAQYNVTVAPVDGTALRQAIAGPGYAIVSDVSADGRLLLTRGDARSILRGQIPGQTVEREFRWLNSSIFPFVSGDGRYVAFEDFSPGAGADYQVALRNVAANTVVHLGRGTALGLSPDGAWAAAHRPSDQKIVFYRTGVGEPVVLDRGPIDLTRFALEWFTNGARVLYCGREASTAARCYAQDIKGGPAAVVTPDDVTAAVLARDDRTLLIRRGDLFQVLEIGGTPVDARGFIPGDELLTWNAAGDGVVVADTSVLPARVDLVEPWSGRRTLLKELAPPDRSGVTSVGFVHWLPDGRGYAYAYTHDVGQLFIVSGWQR
ncbi:MAG: WD40 repeat domain-containing serine/threonine protein kinase [Vicinamibacterales bacterium]